MTQHARLLLAGVAALLALASCDKLRSCASSGAEPVKERTVTDPPEGALPSHFTELSVGGGTPVQGEGRLKDGRAVYFRARHEAWSFGVASSVDEAVSNPTWEWREPWGDRPEEAGYMPEWEARAIVESAAEMLAGGTKPPPSPDAVLEGSALGKPAEEVFARRMARALAADLVLYHGAEIADAAAHGDRAAKDRAAEEYRQEFKKRVDPRYLSVFEDTLAHLDQVERGEQVARWILDEPSGRSVGKRWALALRYAPPSERADMLTRGKRWLAAWSASPEVARAATQELEAAR